MENYLSIVIPAYNEEKRLPVTLQRIKDYLNKKNLSAEIIVVDDGSTDSTVEKIRQLKIDNLKILQNAVNCGKGYAVKRGVLEAKGEYILFTDADNSTPIEELDNFLSQVDENTILIGSRYLKESKIEIKQPMFRVMIGRLGNFLIRLLLFENIKDTQCGFKLFPHKIAKGIFSQQRINRFGFDFEILKLAKLRGYRIRELPVTWLNSPISRVNPLKDTLRTFLELIFIRLNLIRGVYKIKEGR